MKLKAFGVIIFLLNCNISTPAQVPKIIGGHDTNITDVPWQLLHLVHGNQNCGAVIIGPKEVLTAGHCYNLSDPNPTAHTYRAGSNNQLSGGTIHTIESYVVHPGFDLGDDFITHDIAFVRVKEPFQFSETVQPIELAEQEPNDGEEAIISGWGIYKLSGNFSDIFPVILQCVTLPVVGRDKCREWYSDFSWDVDDDMVCVGIEEGGLGACNGDSGGPMVVNRKLVGITSWGDPCATPHHPSVYTSVPYYKDWIKEMVKSS